MLLFALSSYGREGVNPFGKLQDEQKFKDYTVRIYQNDKAPPETDKNPDHAAGFGSFEILREGRQVYFKKGVKFQVGNIIFGGDKYTNNLIQMGRNITGDNEPNLVVSEWSGGAHCCFTFYVFQIGSKFKLLDSVDTRNGSDSDFKDLRGEGKLELVMYDWTFEYWNASFVESPAPMVILQYRNNKYRPDLELIHKPAPTDQELQNMANEVKAKFAAAVKSNADVKWTAPPELWGKMLDLIYSGNMASAWKLWDLSWPANHLGKKLFLKDFTEQLQTSPYYLDINQKGFQKG